MVNKHRLKISRLDLARLMDRHSDWEEDKTKGKQLELEDIDIRYFSFTEIELTNAKFMNVDMRDMDMFDCHFNKCYFLKVDFRGTNFEESTMNECVFVNCNLGDLENKIRARGQNNMMNIPEETNSVDLEDEENSLDYGYL